jgi:hypothetical protein
MKTWLLILGYITLMAGAIGGLYVMSTVTQSNLSLRDAALVEMQRLSGQDEYTRSLTTLSRDTSIERGMLNGFFFSSDLLDAITFIEGIGTDTGVEIEVRAVGNPAQAVGSTLAAVPLTVELTGPFSNILNAIQLFEVSPYALMISQMRITQLEDDGLWGATLQLTVGQTVERLRKVEGKK